MQEFLLASVAVLYFTVFALLWGDDTADEKQKQVFFFCFVFLEGGGCRSYILSDLLTSSFTSCFPVWIKCLAMDTILYQYYANKQWFSSVALWFWVTTSSPDPGSQNRYAFPTKSLLILVPNLDLVYCFCITKLKSWSWYGTLILIIPSISFIDCI